MTETSTTLIQEVPAAVAKPQRAAWGHRLALLLIWLLALGLRVALSRLDRVVWGDEPFYLWLGQHWIQGQGFRFMGHPDVHHGPLFPMLAGLVSLLTANKMQLASEILYAAFGSLLVWPVYAIGVAVYDRRVGLAAAALTAVFPALTVAVLHWGSLTEPIYLFWVYVGLWAGLLTLRPCFTRREETPPPGVPSEYARSAARDPWWAYALSGLAFGLAYLTRPEAFNYFLLALLFFLLARTVTRRWSVAFVAKALLFVLAFALAFMPYAYYTYLQTGAWMVSEKVGVAYLTGIGLAQGDTAAFDKATWGLDSTGLETFFFSSESYNVSMLKLILADPRTFLQVLVLNTQHLVQAFIDLTLFPYALLPLVVLGLLRRGWSRQRTLQELFLIVSTGPVLAFILFFIQARYLVPLLPLFILWTAAGLADLSAWLIGTLVALRTPAVNPAAASGRPYWHMPRFPRALIEWGPVVVVMGVLLLIYPAVLRNVTNTASVRSGHKLVGEWLMRNTPAEVVVMSRYPAIAFHAERVWQPTPNASWAEIVTYARHKKVTHLVIDQRELRYRPQLRALVEAKTIPPEVTLVLLHINTDSNETMVVYQFK